jgi:putative spermidine/putrescine transport system permease protein
MQSNSRTTGRHPSALLLSPALLIITAFFVVPLIWILMLSFTAPDSASFSMSHFTLANYAKFLSDKYYVIDLLWRTVRLSVVATCCAVLIGFAGAIVINRSPVRLQGLFLFFVMCPLWVNLVVRTLSLMVLLGRDGPLNRLLLWSGFIDHPAQLLYNDMSVLIGMIQVSVPFVVLSLHGVLKSIPTELEQAAMSVGANPVSTFMRVTLPLSVPGVLAGSILALGINMESFVVPILLGGGRVPFMSVAAYEAATISNNLPLAATIGMILLIVTLVMLALYQLLVDTAMRRSSTLRVG